jgi:hypothetical protein
MFTQDLVEARCSDSPVLSLSEKSVCVPEILRSQCSGMFTEDLL